MNPIGTFSRRAGRLLVGAALAWSLVSTAAPAEGQNEVNHWVFGNRGWLNFPSGGSPVPMSPAAIATNEGSSSISDQGGNLLFYTDGIRIWNRQHNPMPNGSGLGGHPSSTQSALIVPWPHSECRRYVVFTTPAQEGQPPYTLSYSVVDMGLDGGLGDVVAGSKNIALASPVSEKLAATGDGLGRFWVLAHGSASQAPNPITPVNSEFYAYRVTASGISAPVTSPAGTPHRNYVPVTSNVSSSGQMKISPDGTLIAVAVNSGFVEILNFDRTSGIVQASPVTTFIVPPANANSPFNHSYVYGLEFSPDSKLVYVSTPFSPGKIFQFEIATSTWTLVATGTAGTGQYDIAQLQLGPDGKIYVARNNSTQLGVITNPNTPGPTVVYNANGPTLPPGSTSTLGLPTMIGGTFSCRDTGPVGQLKICKVAGPGVDVGTPFTFNAGGSTFTVPAGPAPGGTCVLGPTAPVGSTVTVVEAIPPGDTVESIDVASPAQQVGTANLATGTVVVTVGSGVTEVTYKNKRTGFVEICKQGPSRFVSGNFTFYVGNLGPFVVPAGACSPAIEVPAGTVTISEVPPPGTVVVGCTTIPPGQQVSCNSPIANTSVVTVAPGDVSQQTIAIVTNGPQLIPIDIGRTATSVTCAPNPSPVRGAVTCTAKVTPASSEGGTPTGTVTFRDGDVALATVPLGRDGAAAFTTSTLAAGTHTIVGAYGGDAKFAGSVSDKVVETITPP